MTECRETPARMTVSELLALLRTCGYPLVQLRMRDDAATGETVVEVTLQRGLVISAWQAWILGGFTVAFALWELTTRGPWWWVALAWFTAANGFVAVGQLAGTAWQARRGSDR